MSHPPVAVPGIQPIPIGQLREEILSLYEPPKMSHRSHNMIRHVFNTLGKIPEVTTTADLTPSLIQRFVEAWGAAHYRGQQDAMQHLRRVCHIAIDRGYLVSSPFTYNPFPRKTRAKGTCGRDLDDSEVTRILEYLGARANTWKGYRLYALSATIVHMHFFKSEVLYLKVGDCDLEAAKIRLNHGRRSPSEFPIPATLAPVLSGWLPLAGQAWLFPNSLSRTTPWTTGNYPYAANDQIRQTGLAIGVSDLTFEALRKHRKSEYDISITRPARREDRAKPRPPPPVVLRGQEDPPQILGKEKECLSFARYNVVRALLLAGQDGLSISELDEKSGHRQARTILWKLKKSDPDWDRVIQFPGKNGKGGYRIV